MAMSEDISRQAVNYQDANNVDKHLLHAVSVSSLLLANISHQISVSWNNHNQFQRTLILSLLIGMKLVYKKHN